MKKLFIISFIAFISTISLNAQKNCKDYVNYVTQRESLYNNKDFSKITNLYEKVLTHKRVIKKFRISDYYYAASAYALTNQKDQAFTSINQLLESFHYTDDYFLTDTDFDNLKADPRWKTVTETIKKNIKEDQKTAKNYKEIIPKLEAIYHADTTDRMSITGEFHNKSEEEKREILRGVEKRDYERVAEVSSILDQYGWLPKSVIGKDASSALFLAIQHSDQKYMGKYLKLLKKTALQGKASLGNYATMLDRYRLMKGKKQIFATQVVSEDRGQNYHFFANRNKDKIVFYRGWYDLASLEQMLMITRMPEYRETTKKWKDFQ